MEKIARKTGLFTLVLVFVVLAIAGCVLSQSRQVAEIRDRLQPGEKATRLKQFEGTEVSQVFLVKGNDEEKVVQKVITSGFVDQISMLVTIRLDNDEVQSVEILQHRETEDYGGYLTQEWFLNRFTGKKAGSTLKLVKMINKTPDEVVAITGATKTSAAVLEGVNLSLENFLIMKKEILGVK